MKKRENIFFASDFHLGLKGSSDPAEREKLVVKWLNSIAEEAKAIYLVGDIFDFWWEYKKVVPKGFTRFLGKISELTDSGIEIHFFTGNHDMWIGDYLKQECGMILHTEPLTATINNKIFHIAHGEGLGINDRSYKVLLWIFKNKFIRRLYAMMHPRWGIGLAHWWSLNSRLAKNYSEEFQGAENEVLFRYANKVLEENNIDYFVFGHRHIALDHEIGKKSRLFILGNWFNAPSYLKLSGEKIELIDFSSYH